MSEQKKIFPLRFQFTDKEHEISARGDSPWNDLLFVVALLAKGINNAIGLKYVLLISLISIAFVERVKN